MFRYSASHPSTMMLVKTIVKASPIEGLGIFADQEVPEGTAVWEFTPQFDLIIDPADIAVLSEPAKAQFLRYAYKSKKSGKYVLCSDDARFFNHDSNPNISCTYSTGAAGEEDICYSKRFISRGEELTCDYREFDGGPAEAFL